jgi:tRNA 2-thiouridine synthesizing protein E
MLDINKALDDRAQYGHDPEGHMYDLKPWSYEVAQTEARKDGLGDVSDMQWRAICILRCLYRKNGRAENAQKLTHALAKQFAPEGGSRYLYELFPLGPIIQGSRFAGLPMPP